MGLRTDGLDQGETVPKCLNRLLQDLMDDAAMDKAILYVGNEPHYLDTMLQQGRVVAAVCEPQSADDEKIWGSTFSRCRKLDCPVIEPQRFLHAPLDEPAFDIMFVAGFGYRIPEPILRQARIAAVNLHQSLLPAYRGRHPVNWAIVNGEEKIGVTLHHMNEWFDDGAIILQRSVAIDPNEGVFTILQRLVATGNTLIKEMFAVMESDKFKGRPQDQTKASHYPVRRPEDGMIDWSRPTAAIHNLIRAVSWPYPGAGFKLNGLNIIIEESTIFDDAVTNEDRAGSIRFVDGRCLIKTGSGFLWVRKLRNQDHWALLRQHSSAGGMK